MSKTSKTNFSKKENKITGFEKKQRRQVNFKQRGYLDWEEDEEETNDKWINDDTDEWNEDLELTEPEKP